MQRERERERERERKGRGGVKQTEEMETDRHATYGESDRWRDRLKDANRDRHN